jgi:uncharacterized protein (TIGR03086 family)
MSEATDRITSMIEGFDARVQATPADAWDNQSPCEEWKARNVVEHVSNNLLRVAGALGAGDLPPVGADEDPPAAWARARDAVLGQLDSADLSGEVQSPFGPMPAEQFLGRVIATDVLVHTWDLAKAVGGDEALPTDAVEGAYSGLKPLDEVIRRPGVFGPKVDVPADADVQTQFLAFLGRPVGT